MKKIVHTHKFRVGDRVRTINKHFAGIVIAKGEVGILGTIVARWDHKKDSDCKYGVQFDQKINGGHDCSGKEPNYPVFKNGYCRWGCGTELEFIEHGKEVLPQKYEAKNKDGSPIPLKLVKGKGVS
jgi:hypothetical protein